MKVLFNLFLFLISTMASCDQCYTNIACMFCQNTYTGDCKKCWDNKLLPACNKCYLEEYTPSTDREGPFTLQRLQVPVDKLLRDTLLDSEEMYPCLNTPDTAHVFVDGSTVAQLDIYRHQQTNETTIFLLLEDICQKTRNVYKGPFSYVAGLYSDYVIPHSIFYNLPVTHAKVQYTTSGLHIDTGTSSMQIDWNTPHQLMDAPLRSLTIDPFLFSSMECSLYDFTFQSNVHVSYIRDATIEITVGGMQRQWTGVSGIHAENIIISSFFQSTSCKELTTYLPIPPVLSFKTNPECFACRITSGCFSGLNLKEYTDHHTWVSDTCNNPFVHHCVPCFILQKSKENPSQLNF